MKELKSSAQKTFAILEYFTVQKSEWGVTELAKAIGSNKSTVYRFLSDLQKIGVLYQQADSEKYRLGLKLFELGNRVELNSSFVHLTHPVLEEVARSIDETVHIAILKNNQVFYVDKVVSPQGLRISSDIGSFNPAYATALGKVLLAYLPEFDRSRALAKIMEDQKPEAFTEHTLIEKEAIVLALEEIKQRGYAIDREELELGLLCLSIPIFNMRDEVIASLSASGPAARFDEAKVQMYVSILKSGADKIREQVGFWKPTIV